MEIQKGDNWVLAQEDVVRHNNKEVDELNNINKKLKKEVEYHKDEVKRLESIIEVNDSKMEFLNTQSNHFNTVGKPSEIYGELDL